MKKLADLTTARFAEELASQSPAPGGGSVAAYVGSLSAALCAMVARLTVGKKKYEAAWKKMETVIVRADRLSGQLIELMDADTDAYNQVVAAFKLPKETDGDKAARSQAIQAATRQAAEVPLATLRAAAVIMDLIEPVIAQGNPNCITDAGTAVQLLQTASLAAAYNVRINIGSLKDKAFADRCAAEVDESIAGVRKAVARLEARVDAVLRRQG